MKTSVRLSALIALLGISLAITPFPLYAGTVILTRGIISSVESCPVRTSKQLHCNTYMQTTSYTCGPAAVMTLMSYYGKLNSSSLNKQTELTIAKEMGADENGTTLSEMTSWLKGHG